MAKLSLKPNHIEAKSYIDNYCSSLDWTFSELISFKDFGSPNDYRNQLCRLFIVWKAILKNRCWQYSRKQFFPK